MNIPTDLKYTQDHEWVKVENGLATVGITDYAQGELGDIIYVDVTVALNDHVKKGEVIGSIEAVKTVSEIYSPITGEISDINDNINNNPSIVNSDAYGEGWLLKIKIHDPSEAEGLLSDSAYKELIGQ